MANDNYGTPPYIIEAARQAMGSIDFDPCTTYKHNKIVGATFISTYPYGLDNVWPDQCNVWMNPPYSRGNIDAFIDKFCEWWEGRRYSQAIVLTNSATDTKWYQKIIAISDRICLPDHRISFLIDGEKKKGNDRSQTLFYFGARVDEFAGAFKGIGYVL